MPRKFTEQTERPTTITISLKMNGGGNIVQEASIRADFGAAILNDSDSNDALPVASGAITFDGLLESRSIGPRTFKQITNLLVDMVKDVRTTPIA